MKKGYKERRCIFEQNFLHRTGCDYRKNFSLNLISGILNGIFITFATSFFSIVGIRLGASSFLVSIIIAAPFVSRLFTPFWATKINRSNILKFVSIPWVVGRGLLILVALTSDPKIFVFIVIVHYIIEAITIPAYTALVKDIYNDKVRGRLMSLVQIGGIIFSILGSLVIGLGLDQVGHQIVFPFLALIGMSSGLVISKTVLRASAKQRESEINTSTIRTIISLIWKNPMYGWYSLGVMVFGMGHLLAAGTYPMYQVKILNLSNFQVGILTACFSLAGIIGTYFSGKIIDQINPIFSAVIMIGIWLLLPTLYLFGGNFPFIILASIFHGVAHEGLSLAYPNVAIYFADNTEPSIYMSIHSTLAGIRGLIAPIIGVIIFEHFSYNGVFTLSAFLILLGLIILLGLMYKENHFSISNKELSSLK
ncbi:MAG: MFS transporter [Thermoanaerobacteraceae bacterium]|nr:MFS transporter [Thermoanaerobacteraceae bacterium]